MGDFYSGRIVTVTGGTGLVGSYFVKELSRRGAKVRAVVHGRPPNEFTRMASEMVKADLSTQEGARKAVRKSEIVIHAAGITGGVPLAVSDPGALVAPNAVLISQVIHACAKEGVERLGFISSTTVYPPLDRPVKEEDAWSGEPYSMYYGIGWVKRYAEKICKYYSSAYKTKIAIVRPSGAYGRFDTFDESTGHVLPSFILRAEKAGNSFKVWGDGGDTRDFVHSSDLTNGTLLAVEKHAVCDPINLASGEPTTTKELAETVLELMGKKARLEFDTSKPIALRSRTVDISKAKREIGYEPQVKLRDGIEDMISWYRSKHG
jgi:GDP-L-fucose synthase